VLEDLTTSGFFCLVSFALWPLYFLALAVYRRYREKTRTGREIRRAEREALRKIRRTYYQRTGRRLPR